MGPELHLLISGYSTLFDRCGAALLPTSAGSVLWKFDVGYLKKKKKKKYAKGLSSSGYEASEEKCPGVE
jgi:hypothetical protein